MKLKLYYPIHKLVISQRFGPEGTAPDMLPMYQKIGLTAHNGWDFVAPRGYNIRAAHDGVVTFTGEDGAGGLGVVVRTNELVDHDYGTTFIKSLYWHCNTGSFKVKPGQSVKVGDILAEVDSTGMSTGDHLHFGIKPVLQGEADWVWVNSEQQNGYLGAIDPAPYWAGPTAYTAAGLFSKLAELQKKLADLLKAAKK